MERLIGDKPLTLNCFLCACDKSQVRCRKAPEMEAKNPSLGRSLSRAREITDQMGLTFKVREAMTNPRLVKGSLPSGYSIPRESGRVNLAWKPPARKTWILPKVARHFHSARPA